MEQVSFQDNGTKVAAVNTKTYIFQRNMSRGPESDLIRTVNIPAMVSRALITLITLSFLNLQTRTYSYGKRLKVNILL